MKSLKVVLCAMLGLIFGLSYMVCAEDGPGSGISQHAVTALGHPAGPKACGQIQHNVKGDALHFVFRGTELTAGKEYILKCCDRIVAKSKADEKGNLEIMASVTDVNILKCIADNSKRRFDLWQGSHRLARSEQIFEFAYQP